MHHERAEQGAKRTKRFHFGCLITVAILLLVTVVATVAYRHRPLSSSVTIAGLEDAFDADEVLVQGTGGSYRLDPQEGLFLLLQLPAWKETKQFSADALVRIQFYDGYTLSLYDNDLAIVYNDYAESGTKNAAYYQMPSSVTGCVQAYLENLPDIRITGSYAPRRYLPPGRSLSFPKYCGLYAVFLTDF